MYCEVESNLYFINNNTYSPELRQTLSMNYLDEIINNSFMVNNLYAYNIYSTNPVALTYEEYTIESALHLTYEPPQKSKWEKFWDSLWNRWWGKVIAVSLTAISFVVTAVFAPCMLPTFLFTLASVGVTLIAGGVIAGILSAERGKGFWNGFFNYINENWAQTLAIEMAMYLVSFGVTQALGIGTKCFIEGTLILTSVGLVKIEDIKEGDEVWSYNEETKEKELKKVKRLFRNKTKEWLHLTILNEETKKEEEIICTKNHRIYIKNKGWIAANEILENEEVLLYNNVIGKVIRKELENLTYEETTYNFEVEDNHNYYVGEECVLVHNECHHIISNKGKRGKKIAGYVKNKYPNDPLKLNESWNKVNIKFHHGRHTNAYHDMIEDIVSQLAESGIDFKTFTGKIEELGKIVKKYYGCLQKNGADAIKKVYENFII